jgi:hypothetical protein
MPRIIGNSTIWSAQCVRQRQFPLKNTCTYPQSPLIGVLGSKVFSGRALFLGYSSGHALVEILSSVRIFFVNCMPCFGVFLVGVPLWKFCLLNGFSLWILFFLSFGWISSMNFVFWEWYKIMIYYLLWIIWWGFSFSYEFGFWFFCSFNETL